MDNCPSLGQRWQVSQAYARGGCRPVVCQPALLINSVPAATLKTGRSRAAGRLPSPPSWALCPQCCLVNLEQLQGISAQAVASITELCLLPSSLHHCSLTVGLRKFCISCCPHAFRFSSGVTSYSACRVEGGEAWGLGEVTDVGHRGTWGLGPLPTLGLRAGLHSPPRLGRQCSGSAQALSRRTLGTAGARWAAARTGCDSHALQAEVGAAGFLDPEPAGRAFLSTPPGPGSQ